MKKTKQSCFTRKRSVKVDDKVPGVTDKNVEKVDSSDDGDQGFGGWLRSSDGMETMKLFVIANSIVMVTTLALPHVQAILDIISEMIYETNTLY